MVALIFFAVPANQARATNSPSWHWEEEQVSPNVYVEVAVDDRCKNASPAFRVTVFTGHNYSGSRARLCGYWDDLGQIPQYRGASSTFNNSISSIWVKELPANFSAQFHFLPDQAGEFTDFFYEGKYDLPVGGYTDNKFSSLRRAAY